MSAARDKPNFFAGAYVERRAVEREAPDWLVAALSDAGTLILVARGSTHLMYEGDDPRIAFLPHTHPVVRSAAPTQFVLLGWFRGARCILLEAELEAPELLPATARFEELRPLASQLPASDAALLAYARALSIWRTRTRYCGVCGAPAVPRKAGHVMRCSDESCAQEYFPRLDPAIIVLVTDGERVLLGRQASWPTGRYSTLAGFVEPGESLEDAVIREVMEETGVRVHDPRYHSSQPWPFPSSLMLGFDARAEAGAEIHLDGELEDARWFSPAELAESAQVMPSSHSISHRLITDWLARRGQDRQA